MKFQFLSFLHKCFPFITVSVLVLLSFLACFLFSDSLVSSLVILWFHMPSSSHEEGGPVCGCSPVGLHGNGLDARLTLGKTKYQEISSVTNKHTDGGVGFQSNSFSYSLNAAPYTLWWKQNWVGICFHFFCPFMMWWFKRMIIDKVMMIMVGTFSELKKKEHSLWMYFCR